MKQILMMIAVMMGQSVLAADKKPLTKEESAKVIEAAIRKAARKPTGELTKADYEKVTKLSLRGNRLTDVTGLEGLNNLGILNLRANKITDLSALANLRQLKFLNISSNQFSDLSPIAKLTRLETLVIAFSAKVKDVSHLKNLTQLKHLNLAHSRVKDISVIRQLKNLESLNLENGYMGGADIKNLANLKKLKHLDLRGLSSQFGIAKLTKKEVSDLQKALPNCKIISDFK